MKDSKVIQAGHPNLDQSLPGPVPHSSPAGLSLMFLCTEDHQDALRDHRTLPLCVLFLHG